MNDPRDSETETIDAASEEGLSLGERAAVGRIGAVLFGSRADPIRFGRYEVVARIGVGAFGRVYRARDPQLRREVALKVLHPSARRKETARIVEEARAMAAVQHPNVATVYDVGVLPIEKGATDGEASSPYIAMELVEGKDLRAWLDEDPSRPVVLEVLRQAGRGLAAAHYAKLVHGDFKPDNLLVALAQGRPPAARVVDFGLARSTIEITDAGEGDMTATSRRLRGTPAYMAPELFAGRTADAFSDQFAFFVTVYEALHGERPFPGSTPMAVAAAIGDGQMRPVDPGLPRRLRAAIVRGLARHPVDRHPTMDAALAAMRPAGRRGRIALAAVAVAVAVAGAVAAVVLPGPGRTKAVSVPGCAPASQRLAAVWNDARRDAGRAAFDRSGLAYASTAWARAEARVDAYVLQWSQAYDDACRAWSGHAPAAARERVACLEDHRMALVSVTDRLVAAMPSSIPRTAELLGGLPDVAECEAPSPAAAVGEDRGRLQRALHEVAATYLAGDFAETIVLAAAAEEQARDFGDERRRGQALGWWARAELQSGEREIGLARAQEAYTVLVEEGDPTFAAQMALSLARSAEDPDAATRWSREALAQIERAGSPAPLVARRRSIESILARDRGDMPAARAHAREAVEVLEAWDPDSVGLVDARGNVGVLAQMAGETPVAVASLEAAHRQAVTQLGVRHPATGKIASNLVLPLLTLGRYHDAEIQALAAMEILGAQDPDVQLNLGIARQLQGEWDAARDAYGRALRLQEDKAGRDGPGAAQVLINLADLDAKTGHLDESLAEIKRARMIFDGVLPEGHPAAAIVYATESVVHRYRGELKLALQRGRAAQRIAVATGDRGLQASVGLELGEAERLAGEATAVATLEAAVEHAEAGSDALLMARLRYALARALPRQDPRVATLVDAARAGFPAQGDPRERARIVAP